MEKPDIVRAVTLTAITPHPDAATGDLAMTEPKQSKTKSSTAFSAEEKAAMKERAREQKAAQAGADGEADVLAKIAEMSGADRDMAERLHAAIKAAAPGLAARTWYGQPAYTKDGKVVCFFQAAQKFNTRYATLGFSDEAKLDDGTMWPTSYALVDLTAADEAAIVALVKRAVG
jgi:hypothetical protein